MMAGTPFTPLRTSRLILRPLRASEAAAIWRYRSLPEVARFQSWEAFSLVDAERLVAGQQGVAPNTPGTWFQLALVRAEGGEVIGDCGLHFRADDPQQVEVGITLAPDRHRHGYAAEALTAVLDYLFQNLGKHRVTATTDAANQPAAALFERLGFRREGHFRQNIWFKGRWGDEFLFALLRTEWRVAGGSTRETPEG
jgi:RimJ/RimL family protein N-acetyltransferase